MNIILNTMIKHNQHADKAIIERIYARVNELRIKLIDINIRAKKSKGWIYNFTGSRQRPIVRNVIEIIAKALECNPDWLQYGEPHEKNIGNILQLEKRMSYRKMIVSNDKKGKIAQGKPVLAMQEAHDWITLMDNLMHDLTRNKTLVQADSIVDSSPDFFPVVIENDLMSPDFKKGDVLIVDPSRPAKISNFVIARLKEKEENIFAQYFFDARENKFVFKFLNSEFPVVVDDNQAYIVGVVIESRKSHI